MTPKRFKADLQLRETEAETKRRDLIYDFMNIVLPIDSESTRHCLPMRQTLFGSSCGVGSLFPRASMDALLWCTGMSLGVQH